MFNKYYRSIIHKQYMDNMDVDFFRNEIKNRPYMYKLILLNYLGKNDKKLKREIFDD